MDEYDVASKVPDDVVTKKDINPTQHDNAPCQRVFVQLGSVNEPKVIEFKEERARGKSLIEKNANHIDVHQYVAREHRTGGMGKLETSQIWVCLLLISQKR